MIAGLCTAMQHIRTGERAPDIADDLIDLGEMA